MLTWYRSRVLDRRTAVKLYGATVAQAREPAFFRALGILDTPEGRSAAIILHLFLVLERLQKAGRRGARIARYLAETFVTDVDDSLREMGVGDLSVPKKVKRAAQALGECCEAYKRAAEGANPLGAMSDELRAAVPGLSGNARASGELASYALAARTALAKTADTGLFEGNVEFPSPVFADNR